MNFARRFRLWRRDHKHLSQKEFARVLGVSRDTVNSIEVGRRRAGYHVQKKFRELVAKHAAAVPFDKRSRKVKWNG